MTDSHRLLIWISALWSPRRSGLKSKQQFIACGGALWGAPCSQSRIQRPRSDREDWGPTFRGVPKAA